MHRGLVADGMSYRWSNSRFPAYGDWDDVTGPHFVTTLDP